MTNAPIGRHLHSAVWTGSEMIIWDGYNLGDLNNGSRYNPVTDSWTPTSTIHAPNDRYSHSAVWTGSEMIVWGGFDHGCCDLNDGGRYNPVTDSWIATSNNNAPPARERHTAVWTGSEMIVWGGFTWDGSFQYLNTGGVYCPEADSPLILDARVRRQNGKRVVVLSWSPADGGSVSLLRNGVVVDTTDDDGAARNNLGTQTGTFYYQVCETDSGTCSNLVRVVVQETGD
jgi:hypothetical protein